MTAYTWGSAKSGNWSIVNDWNPPGVPGSVGGDVATINSTGSSYTVTYDETAETLNALTINSATATLAFNAGETLSINGTIALRAGTIDLLNSGGVLNANDLTTWSGTTINIGVGGTLAYNSASIAGTVDLTGSTTLGAATSVSLSGLIEATAGTGTFAFSAISGTGTLEANGATLDVTGVLANATVVADIAGSAASVFETTGALYYGSSFSFAFLGGLGEFLYNNSASDSNINFKATGLNVGVSKTSPTNFIDLAGTVVAVQSGGTGSAATGSVILTNGDTLTLSGITNVGSGWQAIAQSDGSGGTEIFLGSVCYAAGTRILTALGERPVESLVAGDLVVTVSGDAMVPKTVTWIGQRRLDLASHPRPETVAPICIRRDAFAESVPHSDLWVSPDHAILVDGVLICARQLVNGTTIRQDDNRAYVDYFHVELDAHAILLAEGLPAESYLDTGNRGFFANASDPLVLHPDLTTEADRSARETASCHPFVWDEAIVLPIWQRLAERASLLGQPMPGVDTTTDADLYLIADGQTLWPLLAEDDLHIFSVPAGAEAIRLVSRSGSPTDVRPWLEDRRRLGVYVERIVLRSRDDALHIPLDHPSLSQGWWGVERDDSTFRRWTDGSAVLPLPSASDGQRMLEIRASRGGMTYVVERRRRLAA